MCVVDQQAEVEFLFQVSDFTHLALHTAHTEYAFGNHQDTAAQFVGFPGSYFQFLFAVLGVVVAEFQAFGVRHADGVHDRSMAVGVVHHHVVAVQQAVDGRHDALVTVVDHATVFLVYELGQFLFQLFVVFGLSGHYACAHRVSHAVFGSGFRVGFAHLGVIGQSEVVVQTPAQHFFAVEHHAGTDLAFQLGEQIIALALFVPHFQRAGFAFDLVE